MSIERSSIPKAAAAISVAELFTIGIGPSSSHTIGPMRAAFAFAGFLLNHAIPVVRVQCELYGSLALTGKGHATDNAVILGLTGWSPEQVDPDEVPRILTGIRNGRMLDLGGKVPIAFYEATDLLFVPEFLPAHPNAIRFIGFLADGDNIERTYYSIGGGTISYEGQTHFTDNIAVPYPFASAADLIKLSDHTGLSMGEIVRANECAWHSIEAADEFLDRIRAAMFACIERNTMGAIKAINAAYLALFSAALRLTSCTAEMRSRWA